MKVCFNLSVPSTHQRRRKEKHSERESQILTLLTFKSGTSHTHTHTCSPSTWRFSESVYLWAEHLSHPQTTTEPIIHSSIYPSFSLSSTLPIKINLCISSAESDPCGFIFEPKLSSFLPSTRRHLVPWFLYVSPDCLPVYLSRDLPLPWHRQWEMEDESVRSQQQLQLWADVLLLFSSPSSVSGLHGNVEPQRQTKTQLKTLSVCVCVDVTCRNSWSQPTTSTAKEGGKTDQSERSLSAEALLRKLQPLWDFGRSSDSPHGCLIHTEGYMY